MVGIVQLAEHRIVVPGVVGSSPITHPIKSQGIDTIPWDFKLSVPCGTISTPSVREAMLRIVKRLRA